jgi:hypothetical protein
VTTNKFPPEFKAAWTNPGVKAAFVSQIQPIAVNDCENCGGMGEMYTFIAVEGPYNSPSGSLSKVSHWHNDKWWVGKTLSAPCPECKGEGKKGSRAKAEKSYPVETRVRELADTMKGAR